jgi:hypothetical protein
MRSPSCSWTRFALERNGATHASMPHGCPVRPWPGYVEHRTSKLLSISSATRRVFGSQFLVAPAGGGTAMIPSFSPFCSDLQKIFFYDVLGE